MLKDHKYFHLRQILDKMNDLIFFKSPKTSFRAVFDLFLGIFPKILYPFCSDCILSISPCKNLLKGYWWSKNLVIWFDESILAYNLQIRIFPGVGIAQEIENSKIFHFRLLQAKKHWQNSLNSLKIPIFDSFWEDLA